MAFPSSPPLPPKTAVPISDWPLEHETGDLGDNHIPPQIQLQSRSSRKRLRSGYESLSSDPLFSDEPSEADADDYDRPLSRRKRWYRGPWWEQRRGPQPGLRRSIAKREKMQPADSGIWMGSDASEDSVDNGLGGQVHVLCGVVGNDTNHSPPPGHVLSSKDSEKAARTVVLNCIDNGKEVVDLSDMHLTSLSNETLRPLHQLIRQPTADTSYAPSEEEYHSLTPSIQLFLSGNKLATLPSEIAALTNTTVLSLRNNELRDIPPHIGQLCSLRELNLAQNQIRFLPWALLGLMQAPGSQMVLRPNPFFLPADMKAPNALPHPRITRTELATCFTQWRAVGDEYHEKLREAYRRDERAWSSLDELQLRLKLGQSRRECHFREARNSGREIKQSEEPSIFLVPSSIRFFDIDKRPFHPRAFGSLRSDEYPANLDNPLVPTFDRRTCGVPSLFELSLRSIKSTYARIDISNMLSEIPDDFKKASETLADLAALDSETCTTCGRLFIIARAEWIEYWFRGSPSADFLTEDNIVPYMRRACSWECAVPSVLGDFRS